MKRHSSHHHILVHPRRQTLFSLCNAVIIAVLLTGFVSVESLAQTREPTHQHLMDKLIEIEHQIAKHDKQLKNRIGELEDSLETVSSRLRDVLDEVKEETYLLKGRSQVCIDLTPLRAEFNRKLTGEAAAEVKGLGGIDFYGIGAGLLARLMHLKLQYEGQLKSIGMIGYKHCWEGPGYKLVPLPLGGQAALAQAQKGMASQDLQALAEAIAASASLLDDRIADLADNLEFGPAHLEEKTERVANLLEVFDMPSNPLAFMDGNFTRDKLLPLATLAPSDRISDIEQILNDPGSLVPTDLSEFNICSPDFRFEIPPGALKDLIDNTICGLSPIDFDEARANIQDVADVKDGGCERHRGRRVCRRHHRAIQGKHD